MTTMGKTGNSQAPVPVNRTHAVLGNALAFGQYSGLAGRVRS